MIPPCPAPIDQSDAQLELIPYCSWIAIDGLRLAPKGTAMGELVNEQAVVRVHVNDPLAAQCPADIRSNCLTAIVVESVVWTSKPNTIASPTPTPGVAIPTLSDNPIRLPDNRPTENASPGKSDIYRR